MALTASNGTITLDWGDVKTTYACTNPVVFSEEEYEKAREIITERFMEMEEFSVSFSVKLGASPIERFYRQYTFAQCTPSRERLYTAGIPVEEGSVFAPQMEKVLIE